MGSSTRVWTLVLGLCLSFPLLSTAHGQVRPCKPTSSLVIPPVVKSAKRSILPKDLLALRDVSGLSLSPDGKYIGFKVQQAVLETNSYRTAWFVVPLSGDKAPVNVGDGGEARWNTPGGYLIGTRLISESKWSPDAQWIAYLVSNKGEVQIWRSRRDGCVQEQLTHNAANVESFTWSRDGTKIFFTVRSSRADKEASDKQRYEQGILLDLSVEPFALLRKGRKSSEVVREQTWVYDLKTNHEHVGKSQEIEQYQKIIQKEAITDRPKARSVKSSPNSKIIAFIDDGPSTGQGTLPNSTIYIKTAKDKNFTIPCHEIVCRGDIRELWWSGDGSEIYFQRYEGVLNSLTAFYALSLESGLVREIMKTEDSLSGRGSGLSSPCLVKSERAFCFHEAATKPVELVVIDLSNGNTETKVSFNPEFQNIQLSPATRLEWKNKYGDMAFGRLVLPLGYVRGIKYPLIITTYESLGFLRGGTGDEFPIQAFAANGFAVLSFHRPSGGLSLEGSKQFIDTLRDQETVLASLQEGVKLLVEMGVIDATRVGLCGLSDGADKTLFAISHSDVFHAAATAGGSHDPIVYYLGGQFTQDAYRKLWLGYPEGKDAPNWHKISPALNAARINAPLMIQAADLEFLVWMQTFTALRELGKPVEMFVYPDEGHIKIQPKHRYYVYQRNLDWFKFWLKGDEDTNPAKAQQYTRWRKMRDEWEAAQKAGSSRQ